MKWTFQLALHERMRQDPRIHLLYGDVGQQMFAAIIKEFPDRALNVGLMEQSMVSFAAGMAMSGLRPVCYSILPFLIERAFEQIKLDVDQMNLPVGIVGYSDDECGPTHQVASTHESRSVMNQLEEITQFWPESKERVTEYMQRIDLNHPWFMALGPERK